MGLLNSFKLGPKIIGGYVVAAASPMVSRL